MCLLPLPKRPARASRFWKMKAVPNTDSCRRDPPSLLRSGGKGSTRSESLSPRPDILVMSGSLPPGVPNDFYARAAQIVKDHGGKVILDTSGPALAAGSKEGLFLIKPNLRELRELTGKLLKTRRSWVAACSSLVASGQPEVVALTLGDKGALRVSRDSTLRAPALPINPASTVGAGDSFLGALVGHSPPGTRSGGGVSIRCRRRLAALLSPGTQLCRRDDVERLCSEVIVNPLMTCAQHAVTQIRSSPLG